MFHYAVFRLKLNVIKYDYDEINSIKFSKTINYDFSIFIDNFM